MLAFLRRVLRHGRLSCASLAIAVIAATAHICYWGALRWHDLRACGAHQLPGLTGRVPALGLAAAIAQSFA